MSVSALGRLARCAPKAWSRLGVGLLIVATGCGGHDVEGRVDDLSHPDRETRLKASYELVRLGRTAVAPLIARAQVGPDSLRYIAAQILGRIGDRRAQPILQQLSRDPHEHVRRVALVALGQMGDPGLVDYLAPTLLADSLPELRAAAAQSLGALGDTAAVPALIRALADTSASVRKETVAALNRLWTAPAESTVSRALVEDRDETVRFVAAQALAQHRSVRAREPLRAALRDSNVWVRAEAARGLGALGDAEAVEDLMLLLERQQGPDRDAALDALRTLTGDDYEIANP